MCMHLSGYPVLRKRRLDGTIAGLTFDFRYRTPFLAKKINKNLRKTMTGAIAVQRDRFREDGFDTGNLRRSKDFANLFEKGFRKFNLTQFSNLLREMFSRDIYFLQESLIFGPFFLYMVRNNLIELVFIGLTHVAPNELAPHCSSLGQYDARPREWVQYNVTRVRRE